MKPQPSVFDLEQFRNLAAAEPIRNFLSTSGLTKTPGLNLYDSAKLQAGRQQHWDTIAQAADADRETYKQFLRGLANMSGAKRGPQFEGAIDAASHNVAKIAPYAMTFAPDLWDRLHGNRGSAAALASSVHQIYPERSALENSAFAQQVYKNLYGPGGTGAGGLSAGDIGRTYQAMHSQGLMGRKGGLDAQQASNRLFHGGTAIRSFIDTARDFPKSAAEEGGPSAANSAATPEAPSFVGGAAKLVGGGLAARSLGYSGLARVLGAQHFQHGTSDQAAASIRANGIQPSYGGSSTGSSAAVGSARFMRNSRGHVHVATGPVGRAVARFHAMLSQRNNQPGMGTVIKGYMPYDTFRQNFHVDPDWNAGSIAQRSTSAVPAKSIVQGGPLSRLRTLVANRASSVPAYIRANPGRVGLGALTLGAAGWLGSKALSGGRQVVNSLVGQPQPQVQTANPATTSAAAAPSVKSAGSRPWLDDNEKRTLASSAMLGGGLLGSLLIPGLPGLVSESQATTIAKKGSGPVKEAAETDQLLPPVPGPSASTSAMGYGAAAAGLGAGLAAGSRPVARTAFNLVDKHLPFDSGLANRVESYRRGMAAAGNDASKLLSEYIRGGHDILSNNAFRGVPGLETAKNIHQNPVMKALAGDQNLWKTKQQHFSEFAASPVRGLSQIVRELHGDKAEDFVSPRFKPQYRSVEAEIARAAKLRKVDPKLWYQDATLKARFQPQFDSIDAAKRKVLAGLGRNAAVPDAAPKLLHNELWRTVRRFSPALSAEIAAAGVKSPADLAKLPPATQNKIVQLFAEKSEVGQHTSRLFRHAWREAAPFYNRMADRALPAIRWSDRLRRVLPRIVRHAPAVATGSAIGAGVLGAGWLAGRGNDAKAHAQRTLDWRKGIVDQAREAALSDQAALQSLRKPGVLTRMGLV